MSAVKEHAAARAQQGSFPKDDVTPYVGQWIAVRDSHVIAADPNLGALRANPNVHVGDAIAKVPANPSAPVVR